MKFYNVGFFYHLPTQELTVISQYLTRFYQPFKYLLKAHCALKPGPGLRASKRQKHGLKAPDYWTTAKTIVGGQIIIHVASELSMLLYLFRGL